QLFDQNFSAITLDRNNETLTRVQRVPVQVIGFSGQWMRVVGATQTLVAGLEGREVRGSSDELAFVNGRATSFADAGGRERGIGGYVEDVINVHARLFVNLGMRLDHWRNFSGFTATRPIASEVTNRLSFIDRTESAFSPHLSALFKANDRVSVTAAVFRAFRAPTLNELYRSFRVGNVLTLANEQLRAERLTGGETGARVMFDDRFSLRATLFWNGINRPVANVTLQTTPALITRQRQNLGRTRSRGLELQLETTYKRHFRFSSGYLFADATVVKFPANTALEGRLIPQVARHQLTFQSYFDNPSQISVGVQARASSAQFDDDQNIFHLAPYFTMDAFVSRRLNRKVELFVAVENLLNGRYEIGKTPATTVGPPILFRGGLRLRLGTR
ncbi:MAG: TonB-dependent receptor, partial [Pyrinomonadaceae bacterium]